MQRWFGTSKEELRQCNVTTNHSCQEIPSQTYEDIGQLEDGNEVSSKKVLWGDEIEVMEAELGSNNKTVRKEDRGNMQLQKTVNLEDVTVNPSNSTARVLDSLPSTVVQGIVSAGDYEKGIELEKQRFSTTTLLAKEQSNGTVKPSFPGRFWPMLMGSLYMH